MPRVQACLHFITRYKHAETRATASREYSPIILVSIYRGGIQPIMSVYCQTPSFVCVSVVSEPATLTILLVHFERFSYAESRYVIVTYFCEYIWKLYIRENIYFSHIFKYMRNKSN